MRVLACVLLAIDVPLPGWADEQHTWSPDGGSIASCASGTATVV